VQPPESQTPCTIPAKVIEGQHSKLVNDHHRPSHGTNRLKQRELKPAKTYLGGIELALVQNLEQGEPGRRLEERQHGESTQHAALSSPPTQRDW